MEDMHQSALSFEKAARSDFRIWIAFVVGCLLAFVSIVDLTGSTLLQIAEAPTWMPVLFLLAGLGMGGVAALCLVFNTSRGCFVDEEAQELIWWQMKFAHQGLHTRSRMKLSEIGKLHIDSSNEGTALSLFNIDGQKQDSFSEVVLPPDYEKWCKELAAKLPQIRVEKA